MYLFAAMLAVHSLVVLVTAPAKNTSELVALFVRTFLDESSLLRLPPDARSYISLTDVEQC